MYSTKCASRIKRRNRSNGYLSIAVVVYSAGAREQDDEIEPEVFVCTIHYARRNLTKTEREAALFPEWIHPADKKLKT